MPKLRTIPFGYTIQNGKTIIESDEAQTVIRIFELYTEGRTLQQIADELIQRKIPFFRGKVRWNKNAVKRILENEKYIGEDAFASIVPLELFRKASEQKGERSRPTAELTDEITQIKSIAVCGHCGARYKRINTWGSREKWLCAGGCKCSRFVDDTMLMKCIHDTVDAVIGNPDLLSVTTYSAYTPSKSVLREENELMRLLEQPIISFMASAKSILQAAALRFQSCNYDRGEMTAALQEELIDNHSAEPLDRSVVSKYIKAVRIYPNGRTSVVFYNGAEVSVTGGIYNGNHISETSDED